MIDYSNDNSSSNGVNSEVADKIISFEDLDLLTSQPTSYNYDF